MGLYLLFMVYHTLGDWGVYGTLTTDQSYMSDITITGT